MDDSKGTLKMLLMKKINEEIDPKIRDIVSYHFESSRFSNVSEIKLEDILKEVHISNLTSYFRGLREEYENLTPKNWKKTAYKIKGINLGFFKNASSNNRNSVISYLLFSDYLIENLEKFEEISNFFQKDLDFINTRISGLERIIQGRKKNIRVKLFSWLPKKLSSLLRKSGKKGRFGKFLRSYLRADDELSHFTNKKDLIEKEVSGSLLEEKRIKLSGLGLADKLMRRYQQEFYSHKDPYLVLLKISECRIDYTKELIDIENKSTYCSLYVDALVKNARLIKEPTKRIEILNMAKPYLSNIYPKSPNELGTHLISYISLSVLTNLEAHGEIKWEEIPVFYDLMKGFNEKTKKIIQSLSSDSKKDLGRMAHVIRHSNEEFSKFLKSIREIGGFMDCLKPYSNNPMADFEELYSHFLSLARSLISMKEIPSWDNSSYKYNPYAQRGL